VEQEGSFFKVYGFVSLGAPCPIFVLCFGQEKDVGTPLLPRVVKDKVERGMAHQVWSMTVTSSDVTAWDVVVLQTKARPTEIPTTGAHNFLPALRQAEIRLLEDVQIKIQLLVEMQEHSVRWSKCPSPRNNDISRGALIDHFGRKNWVDYRSAGTPCSAMDGAELRFTRRYIVNIVLDAAPFVTSIHDLGTFQIAGTHLKQFPLSLSEALPHIVLYSVAVGGSVVFW
jgi:hypothetical protein